MTTIPHIRFEPVRVIALAPRVSVDGLNLLCAFESSWCRAHIGGAGGFDIHHQWPRSMGGPAEETDAQHLLYLCPMHHRRQHALIRAMVESGTTDVKTVRYFAAVERQSATYAVTCWLKAGKPPIRGWECPAAALKAA